MKKEYLHYHTENFGSQNLRLPMFYLFDIALRFDLQSDHRITVNPNNNDYFNECFDRSIKIFDSIFEKKDPIYIIVNSFRQKREKLRRGNYIFKQISDLNFNDIYFRKILKLYDQSDPNDKWNQAIILTTTDKLNYKNIITGLINTDFPSRSPRIIEELFFINIPKKVILNIYDDRGLDIVAKERESIRSIYENLNHWILDYDKERMEKLFLDSGS